MTRDIDIIVLIGPADAKLIVELLRSDFYIDEDSVRQALRERGMFNAIHNETVIKVDFIVRKDDEYRIEEFSRRRSVEVEGTPIEVVAPEDLVLSKLIWAQKGGSELQVRDVGQMLKSVSSIDHAYLHSWAQELGVAELLDKARQL